MTSSSTATHTHPSPALSRLTQLIGKRSPQPSHAQPSSSSAAAAPGEDEWYIPYRGPYESPKPKSAAPAVNATWSGGQGSGWHAAVTDSEAGWTSASEREDDGGGVRGRSSRRRALTTTAPQRKSFASSVYAPSSSRMSAPSFLSLDDGGIGESPAPPVRSSVIAYYAGAPAQPEQSTSASTNNRWSLFKRQSSHQLPQTPPRSRSNTLQPQSSQTQSQPHAYNQYGYLPPAQHPQERTLRQKSSEPLLSTFGRTSTSPSAAHPYARMSAAQISRPLGIVSPPQGGTFHSQGHAHAPQAQHYQYHAQQQHAFPQHPSSAPPQTSHQPDTHIHHAADPLTPPQQRLAPPTRGGGGILRGLKASLSSPNLRAAFHRLSPSPAHTPPAATTQNAPRMFEAETWCDALLFPRPRFRAHVVSPPPSPGEQQEVLRERERVEREKEREREREKERDRDRDVHPIEKIGEEVDREERLSRQGTRLRKRSHTLRPSASTANLSSAHAPKTLEGVLREGSELDKERSQWDAQARRSFANKRSRSLSRSALRNAKVRVLQADYVDEYPAATPGADEGKTRGLEKLAVVAFAQTGRVRTATAGSSSAHTNSRRGEDSSHTRSGGSRSGHSRTTSLGTNPTQSHGHSHRRSESWGRAALKKAGMASNCFDHAESPTPTTERGHEADLEKALMSGGTVRLKVRSRVSEDEQQREVLEIAPSPVTRAHPPQARGVATPSPVVGLAVSTPEPQPPEIVIHAHPYSPHSHAHSHTHNHSITSSINSNSIAARHRLPPQAPDEPAKDKDPGKRMYALSRSGVIREVHARELAASPMASPLRERMPAHMPGSPSAGSHAHSLAASPSQWGVDRTADLPFIDVDPADAGGERDADGRPLSIAPARGGRERNARAYANAGDRTSTLGVEEVLAGAFRRLSTGDGELDAAAGTFGGNGVGVEEALAAYARMQDGRGGLDDERDGDMGASTPALTRAPSEEAGQTLASSKLLRSDPSLGNLLSREPSGAKPHSTPALIEEDERKISEDSLGASSRSSPKVSPRPLGSIDDLELYHDLFWDPNSEGRPLGHARSGSALGLAVGHGHGHSRSPSGGGRAGSAGGRETRSPSQPQSHAGHQRTESAGGRARSPSNAHAHTHQRTESSGNANGNGHARQRTESFGNGAATVTHTHTRNNSTSSTKVPFIARHPRPSYSPTRREYSPTRHDYSPAIREREREQDGYFQPADEQELERPKRVGRSRSGTFGSTYRRDVPRDVELESEEEEQIVHIQEQRPIMHSINVTTPRPDEEIRSAHPSLTLSPDGGTLSLVYDPPSALDVHPDSAHARASSQFSPDPRLSLNAPDPRHSQLTRASYATTASSNNLSLIADFPSPPTQELMSRAVHGYFASQNAHGHPLRDDESAAHYNAVSEESLPGRLHAERLRGGDGETPRGVYGVASRAAISEEGELDGGDDADAEYFHPQLRDRRELPLQLPSMARANRSTFGGEGELADAWEAQRSRYD